QSPAQFDVEDFFERQEMGPLCRGESGVWNRASRKSPCSRKTGVAAQPSHPPARGVAGTGSHHDFARGSHRSACRGDFWFALAGPRSRKGRVAGAASLLSRPPWHTKNKKQQAAPSTAEDRRRSFALAG